jgi:hypothetical protein
MNLKDKAIKMAEIYKRNSKVDAVLLAGSVSRGWEDKHSDIELHILWRESPSDKDRVFPIKSTNGKLIDFQPYEDEEWSETYISDGVKFEISNFLTQTVENVLRDVIEKYDTDYSKQCIAASVYYGQALCGNKILHRLKQNVLNYPPSLSEKMILENLEFGSRWTNRYALLDREDWLMLFDVIVSTQRKILGVLFGLNKMYVHHPAFKWLQHSAQLMKIKPDQFCLRLTDILKGEPSHGIKGLEKVVAEIYSLVEQHHPHLDISTIKIKSSFVRPEQLN